MLSKSIFFLLLLPSLLFSFDIDVQTLKSIIKENPNAYREKVLLAKYYYTKKDFTQALELLDNVLQKNPKNKNALKLKKDILKKQNFIKVLKDSGLNEPLNVKDAQQRLLSYYQTNNYQHYSNLFQALLQNNIKLEDGYYIKAAYIYLWDGDYKESENALSHVQEKNNLDVAKIQSDICYFQGRYKCAIKYYEQLFEATQNKEYAYKLIYSYLYSGMQKKAQKLYQYLIRHYPTDQELQTIHAKLESARLDYLTKLQKAYESNPSYTTLKAYATALYALGYKEKNLTLLREYNQKNASKESLLLEAQYLTWDGDSKKALQILHSSELHSDLEAQLLLGQIYSWNQEYKKAKKHLNYVIEHSHSKTLLFDAKKALTFTLLWEGKKGEAKELFTQLQKQRPHDSEINEALMELNNNYAELIKIYAKRVKDQPSNTNALKHLAELYKITNNNAQAIALLSKYIHKVPDDLEAIKELALLEINNKDYYKGFGDLEYYTAQKRDTKSAILLAQNYYWSGFPQEALSVLKNLLEKDPNNNQALLLKAKILKAAPRYTTSNSGATVQTYFSSLAKQQLAIADALYFNLHYKASLLYFQDYLKTNPTDTNVRFRYAYALENAKKYALAEGEFSLLRWTNDSDEVNYHYAYNLLKNGKLKLAKKELLQLQQTTYKTLTPKLQKFLNDWKNAWESQNFTNYQEFYSQKFRKNHLWSYKKQQLFSTLKFINVGIYDPIYKKISDNTYKITFYQEYASSRKKDKGYKTLTLQCDKQQTECVITEEKWSPGKYKKQIIYEPYIEKALKEIQKYEKNPSLLSSLTSKKKTLCNNKIA